MTPRKNTYTVEPEPDSYGELMRDARLAKGWSQVDLAEQVGTGQNIISAYERGRTKRPEAQLAYQIEKVLGLPEGILLERAGWGRGARRHRQQAPPIPGSVVIEPDPSDPCYLIAKRMDADPENAAWARFWRELEGETDAQV